MSKKLIEDSETAFEAWKDAPRGSYIERTMADAIVADQSFRDLIQGLRKLFNLKGAR